LEAYPFGYQGAVENRINITDDYDNRRSFPHQYVREACGDFGGFLKWIRAGRYTEKQLGLRQIQIIEVKIKATRIREFSRVHEDMVD
jgi:hypothetical protein